MHTARCAGTSIGQGFDHDVSTIYNLMFQFFGGDVGESCLAVTLRFQAAFAQEVFDAVEEFTGPGLRDIQEADGQAVQ